MSVPTFRTIEEMEKYFYGDLDPSLFKKAYDTWLSSDTGQWLKLWGAKVWSQINYEQNAFAVVPKEPWVKTGWRLETAAGFTFPSGGTATGTATTAAAVPGTLHSTIATVEAPFKHVVHSWSADDFAVQSADVDDSLPIEYRREQTGKAHARAISAYLIQDTDTPASTGFESLDRVASNAAESTTDYYSATTDPDIYSYTRASGAYDAKVSAAGKLDANLRDLTVTLIDTVWQDVTKAGGMPKVLLTGYNTTRVWNSLLEAERRFNAMQIATFVPRFNGAAGVQPGVEAGFAVATYFGVPIIPCQDYDSSIATARTNEVAPILYLDTDFIRFAVKQPTKYVESDDQNKFSLGFIAQGYYETWGELRCYNFAVQGKLRDLK